MVDSVGDSLTALTNVCCQKSNSDGYNLDSLVSINTILIGQ